MESWILRPSDVASLLNPAFCSIILAQAARGFTTESPDGLPFALSALVIPFTLHRHTRQCFPQKTSTKFHVWLEGHPEIRLGLGERAKDLVPFTREAVLFGLQHQTLLLTNAGNLLSGGTQRNLERQLPQQGDAIECVKSAQYLGRWFAKAGAPNTLYALLGIQP